METRSADVAIIGAGIVGLSLAEALIERGASVLVFDRGVPGQAQSGGVTRIFRHTHAEVRLIRLALRARTAWRELEGRSGRRLVGSEGVIALGDPSGAARLSDIGVDVEILKGDELRERLPIAQAHQLTGVLERDAGAIRVRDAVHALVDAVSGSLVPVEVYGLASSDTQATIYAADGVLHVGEVFVTAGAGTAAFAAAAGIQIPEVRSCHLRVTFARSPAVATLTLPCLLDRSGRFGETVYGSPTPDASGYAIGISGADGSVDVDGVAAADPSRLAEILHRTQAYAERAFGNVLDGTIATRVCLATPLNTSDDDFRVWRERRLTFLAGHNLFKFAPLIGQLLADSALGGDIPRELAHSPATAEDS
jgi:sarcosine oxidase